MFEEICKKYEPADISVYIPNRGLVCKEKSLVACDRLNGKIVAFGTEAEHIAETAKGNILVYSPLRQGIIADYCMAVKLFTFLLHKALGGKPLRRPVAAICVPQGISEMEKRAAEEVIHQAGAREIIITDIPVDQFIRDIPVKFPNLYQKSRVIIGITKDEPERYIREQLADTIGYAAQMGISAGRVAELLSFLSDAV